MKRFKYLIVVVFASLLLSNSAYAEIKIVQKNEIGLYPKHTLSPQQKKAFDAWKNQREREYYGAFVIDTKSNAFYGVDSFRDKKSAVKGATIGCGVAAEGKASQCVLYAVLQPKGGGPASSVGDTNQGQAVYLEGLRQNADDENIYQALAVTAAGAWSNSLLKQNKKFAVDDALERCRFSATGKKPDSWIYEYDRAVFNAWVEAGMLECKIFLIFDPEGNAKKK